MKVKIIADEDFQIVEEQVNKWLSENSKVKIKFIEQTTEPTRSGTANLLTVSIFYEEPIKGRVAVV